MKIIKYVFSICLAVLTIYSCSQDDDNSDFLDSAKTPTNISANVVVTQDNTGLVTITPLGEGAASFNIDFGDQSEVAIGIQPGSHIDHTYAEGTYNATITGVSLNGNETSISQQIVVAFQAPENLVVTIENDATISRQVNVTAIADFAISYEVSFGDPANTVLTANNEATTSFIYDAPGVYTITVTSMSAAIETATYTEDFEVTEILQPISGAPNPPSRDPSDVISFFSDAYATIPGVNYYPNWGQATTFNLIDLAGNEILQYGNLNYQGIDFAATPVDASQMEFLHIDVWTADDNDAKLSPISPGPNETAYDLDITPQQWTSFDIPISFFMDQNPLLDFSQIFQFKFDGDPAGGTIFVDNLYFWKEASGSTFDGGLIVNGDFEAGADPWIVGVDDNTPAPIVTLGGDTYYSVNVMSAGNPFDVNMSQKLEIIDGTNYTLTFDAWSDTNRSIIAGIGLSADPWSNDVGTVTIDTNRTTYSLTLSASGWGAIDARVLFDVGAETGLVNIDNVSLVIGTGNLVVNGDFEAGAAPWIVGVDDNTPAPVITEGGNSFYSVNVMTAGNPFDVNMSQKLEIVDGTTYTMTFDAWSDTDRSIIAGIGLSGDPWSNDVETVNINTTRTTYTITISAEGWGAIDARVLFDVGAETGMVNIDDVSLSIN